jgi:sulfur carrier protein ThiS
MPPLTVPGDLGLTLLEILRSIGLEDGTYSILVLNGALVDAQAVPEDGDVIDVYPPLSGG